MMSVLILSICVISVCFYEFRLCNAHNIKYQLKENSAMRDTYRQITREGRIACAVECAKDPWCLSSVYDEGLRTCKLSSYSPDEPGSETEEQTGSKTYYQNVQELTAVKGITTWQLSIYEDAFGFYTGSLTIDRSFGTTHLECFHTLKAAGNYLIVELETTAKLVHVDILFRSDLSAFEILRNSNITVLIANSLAVLDTNQANACGHYDGPPVAPHNQGRVKCAPNSTGKYVKFLHNIEDVLNICEVSFYSKM